MLQSLDIRHYVLVEECHLELFNGMTVLTGETGAGKSILIDALGLILGARAEQNSIREGSDKAEIAATFLIDHNQPAQDWMHTHDLEAEDVCIIRRIISREGRTRTLVNGRPVSIQELKTLTCWLVDIQGQHAHQQLLHKDHQRLLLDSAAKQQSQLVKVKQLYNQWYTLSKELDKLDHSNNTQLDQIEVLKYQIGELQRSAVSAEDLDLLEQKHKRLSHQQEILTNGHQALEYLSLSDGNNALDATQEAQQLVRSLLDYEPRLQECLNCLESASIHLEEAQQELRALIPDAEDDQNALNELESQLQTIYDLARKHRIKPQKLVEQLDSLEHTLNKLNSLDETRFALQQTITDTLNAYQKLAKKVHQARLKAAKKLSQQINEELAGLGLEHAEVDIQVEFNADNAPSPIGLDTIQFMVSTNPGQPMQPLSQIASGGELSRFSLAIQTILATDNAVPTLIFDEVDSGIGGAVAEMVGQKMNRIGDNHQILCVTHLAQVAAQANQHILVQKSVNQKTTTQLQYLNDDARVEEIARMLGGAKLTQNSRTHAQEMLNAARDKPFSHGNLDTSHTG